MSSLRYLQQCQEREVALPTAKLPEYEAFCQGALADIYPLLHQLREADPVHWSEPLSSWMLTRYVDVYAAFRDPRLCSSRIPFFVSQLPKSMWGEVELLEQHLSKWIVVSDPPDHTRLRALLSKAFTPRVVENIRGHIQDIADWQLDRIQDKGRMDLIADFAYSLPATVICEMLGVPARDHSHFRRWSEDVVAFSAGAGPALAAIVMQSQKSLMELTEYFRGVIADARQNRPDNLLGALVAVEEQGDRLTEQELLSMCSMLFVAGHETTMILIGNGVLALLEHPEEMGKLKNDPARQMTTAVEEFLRYDAPLQRQTRLAREDLQIAGKSIKQGDAVLLMQGAANRDPAQFSEPDRLDISRPEKANRHVAFGWGIHFCVGAPLARLEGKIAFETLLRRMPNLRLAGEPLRWRKNMGIRGLTALHVEF